MIKTGLVDKYKYKDNASNAGKELMPIDLAGGQPLSCFHPGWPSQAPLPSCSAHFLSEAENIVYLLPKYGWGSIQVPQPTCYLGNCNWWDGCLVRFSQLTCLWTCLRLQVGWVTWLEWASNPPLSHCTNNVYKPTIMSCQQCLLRGYKQWCLLTVAVKSTKVTSHWPIVRLPSSHTF